MSGTAIGNAVDFGHRPRRGLFGADTRNGPALLCSSSGCLVLWRRQRFELFEPGNGTPRPHRSASGSFIRARCQHLRRSDPSARPNTTISISELEPRRFAPWTDTQAASPNRHQEPGTTASGSCLSCHDFAVIMVGIATHIIVASRRRIGSDVTFNAPKIFAVSEHYGQTFSQHSRSR